MVEQNKWVCGSPEAKTGDRGLGRLVDLAVDTSQEELGQAGGGHFATSEVRFSINHILGGSSDEMQKPPT
jgi:hypothetical protein